MLIFNKQTKTFKRLFIALAALSIYFTTCDMPMGLGDPIDWDPPVLTMDPGYPNPLYVRLGTMLAGTVTDNIGVDRVILRNANTGEQMFKANLLPNNRWEIALDFSAEQNGEKIAVEIVAFDRVGNSGDSSIAAITLIIDIRPPIIKDIKISRTAVRDAYLETYHELFDLERTDPYGPYGTLSANVNKYQNGFFYIKGEVSEQETRIEVLGLNIYDANLDPNTPLLLTPGEFRFSLPKTEGSDYAPIWLVKEEDILNAGNLLWSNYKTNYENGSRYYYRVAIYAIDRSGNEGESLIIEDEGFFCMWEKGDEPKGIIDRLIGSVVTRGATIPIEFFDDDTLDWAYVGLLTQDQWDGIKDIAPGTTIPQTDNDGKILWLKERLLAGDTVYDWKFDKKPNDTQQPITDQIAGKTFDERIIYIQTGNDESDTGIYVLFTLTADKKLDPHTGSGPMDTNKPRWKGRFWNVDVIDENAPLIVFDTVNTNEEGYKAEDHTGSAHNESIAKARTGDSPEENTFPKLTEGSDGNGGRYFEINGYTLRAYREDQEIQNSVIKFRMAWIPFGMGGGHPDDYITAVQNALRDNYPNSFSVMGGLAGIQHWEFTSEPSDGQGEFILGTPEAIGDSKFKKQVFRKRFDVLGGADDLKSAYNNFTYNDNRENETKLFVFYAEDNVGHEVFRQLRLLGNKTPPDLAVYDITGKDGIYLPPGLPNLNNSDSDEGKIYFNSSGNIDGTGREEYRNDLFAYQPSGYSAMKPVALSGAGSLLLTDADRTEPYQAYPRDTIIKYWVMAEKSGDLAVSNINMQDITYSTDTRDVGYYNDGDRSLSYVEILPEVTQRVFLFTAKDTLDNEVRIQRTVAVTNAAVLNNITTTTQSGDYGIGQTITLQANFSNLVIWRGTNPPLLNVRFLHNGSPVLRQIATKTPAETQALFLEFDFVIEENSTGILETMHYGMDVLPGSDTDRTNRPITIPAGTRILDPSRDDDAFTPRNVTGFDWTAAGQGPKNSLQGSKKITLDGIRPIITGFTLNPPSLKTLYDDSHPGYYFTVDETIQFTLTANKSIFTSGDPIVEFQIGSSWIKAAWQRASDANGMVFSVLVNSANTPTDGTVTAIRLEHVDTIVDNVGNAFNEGTSTYTLMTHLNPNVTIHVDKKPPEKPVTNLTGTPYSTTQIAESAEGTLYFKANPILAIPNNTSDEDAPVVKTQYSLNNGVIWKEFSPVFESDPAWTSGTPSANDLRILPGEWTLVTRYIDRAGNEGKETIQPLHVNDAFPKLIAVTPVQANGWYGPTGTIQTLSFNLNFEDGVKGANAGNQISITLRNRSSANNGDAVTSAGAATATATLNTNLTSTITVSFSVTGREMRDGLYVSAVDFSNLRDAFGNQGGTWNGTWTSTDGGTGTNPRITPNTSDCPNLEAGLKVDAINPAVTTYSPALGTGGNPATGAAGVATTTVNTTDDFRNRITLTFREPVMKGNGTITIKPKSDFSVPPVFENNGYYLDQFSGTGDIWARTEVKSEKNVAGKTTWVPGFYDIYNSGLTAAQRNNLTQGTTVGSQSATVTNANYTPIPSEELDTNNPSMSRLRLNRMTGQPVGPYVRTTHGLVQGAGYSGSYAATTGANGPAPNGTYMVPDTSTKWVLAFPYSISNADNIQYADVNNGNTGNALEMVTPSNDVVNNIRAALVAAKFRWQEIDVISSNVTISGNTVTITLTEPLLKGLQWELSYPAETFTDMAGNNAPALAAETYVFWSPGAQKPVVRVDRRSYDGRTTNWQRPNPANSNNASSFTHADPTVGGWGIADFESIAYRIETETPGATIYYGTYGRDAGLNSTSATATGTGPFLAVTAAWTGDVARVNQGVTGYTASTWEHQTATEGQWVRPNLIRRGHSGTAPGTALYYTVNGVRRTFQGTYNGLRSYNADAQLSNFTGNNATGADSRYRGTMTFDALEAGKSYVFADARITNGTAYTSNMGYEGVFRTVIALYYSANTTGNGPNIIIAEGSNIKNGMPSISGFPIQDAAETGDARFVKLFRSQTANRQFYWVSTEIVSEFYFIKFGGGGSHQNIGEVNNYLTVGYGDLTYSRNLTSYGN